MPGFWGSRTSGAETAVFVSRRVPPGVSVIGSRGMVRVTLSFVVIAHEISPGRWNRGFPDFPSGVPASMHGLELLLVPRDFHLQCVGQTYI